MKSIKITLGGYGYRKDSKGPVQLITKDDGPIDVSDAEAIRLVELLKVAEYAEEKPADKAPEEDAADEEKSYKELQAEAKSLGIPAKGTKEELAEKIKEAQQKKTEDKAPEEDANPEDDIEDPADGEDDEQPPVLEAAEPEV